MSVSGYGLGPGVEFAHGSKARELYRFFTVLERGGAFFGLEEAGRGWTLTVVDRVELVQAMAEKVGEMVEFGRENLAQGPTGQFVPQLTMTQDLERWRCWKGEFGEAGVMKLSENRAVTDAPEEIAVQVHGADFGQTLIYLPGLHGDWTLIGRFRNALRGRVRFVEVTYPRTLTWSLEDYAEGVERGLADKGITRGWVLAESFSSGVLWPLVARKNFTTEGVILAGGFVRHPTIWGVRMAERIASAVSLALLTRILFGYARLARFRYRKSPETLASIQGFIARRTKLDQQAAKHRLHLIAQDLAVGQNPCEIARAATVPVYGITGLFDPVVPWYWVRRWLKKNCPGLREYRVIWLADHNVLGTAAEAAAEQVVRWIGR